MFYKPSVIIPSLCRWCPGSFGLPTRSGKLKDLTLFDATFFGVHAKQASKMDPQVRMLLEVTFEAIVDAGKCVSCLFMVSSVIMQCLAKAMNMAECDLLRLSS